MRYNLAESQTNAIFSDFRKTTWGMSRSEVKLAECRYPLSENETHITYKDQFVNLEATVGFRFINDSLFEAGYAFHEVLTDPESYIYKYEKLRLELSYCYGDPIIDKVIVNSRENDSCRMQPSPSTDNKIFIAEWKTTRSIIRLLLVSDNLSTEFGILYISRENETDFNISTN